MHHQNPTYAAMVDSLDQNVGRILQKIEQLGIADRTVVILTSDNGGFINKNRGQTVTSNAPLRSGKGSLWEGGVRVPLLVRWPGVTPAGAVCAEPVSTIDFYPTILQIAGLRGDAKHNAHVDGLSLVPLLKNPQGKLGREALYFHYPHYYPTTTPVSSVRARDWKLIEFHKDMHVELYNLREDPSEQRDLAAEMPDRASRLRQRLHAWRAAVDAQMPERQAPNEEAAKAKTVAAGGLLTLDGQPVAGASIVFMPQGGGRPALGRTDQGGRYTLTTFEKGDGAPPGAYSVAISLERMGPNDELESLLPRKYARPETSGLVVEVSPRGSNEFSFELTSN